MATVLIVDHRLTMGFLYREFLQFDGHRVVLAQSSKEADGLARNEAFDVAVIDEGIHDSRAVEIRDKLKSLQPHLQCIISVSESSGFSGVDRFWDGLFIKSHSYIAMLAEVGRLYKRLESDMVESFFPGEDFGNAPKSTYADPSKWHETP